MTIEKLSVFVRTIMNINATTAGMGNASAGVRGTDGSGEQTVYRLKRVVIEFASEYNRSNADTDSLSQLAEEIEGSLRTLQVLSTITREKSDQLIAELESLLFLRRNHKS